MFPGEKNKNKTKNKTKRQVFPNGVELYGRGHAVRRTLRPGGRRERTAATAPGLPDPAPCPRWLLESSLFVFFFLGGPKPAQEMLGSAQARARCLKQTKFKALGAIAVRGQPRSGGLLVFCQREKQSGGGGPAQTLQASAVEVTRPQERHREGGLVFPSPHKALGPFILPYQQQSSCPQPFLVL